MHECYGIIMSRAYQDKQLVVLIFQLDTIKPLQQNRCFPSQLQVYNLFFTIFRLFVLLRFHAGFYMEMYTEMKLCTKQVKGYFIIFAYYHNLLFAIIFMLCLLHACVLVILFIVQKESLALYCSTNPLFHQCQLFILHFLQLLLHESTLECQVLMVTCNDSPLNIETQPPRELQLNVGHFSSFGDSKLQRKQTPAEGANLRYICSVLKKILCQFHAQRLRTEQCLNYRSQILYTSSFLSV